jgi:hypothetical protein
MFPDLWRLPPHNAMATASSPKAINRAVIAVKSAMIKYPSKVLVENLGQIYIVGSLEFDGISAAGTNSTEEVYIAARDLTEGFTDEYLESTFHHEFSSILLRNFPDFFRRPEWINTNPMGFRYGESGVDSIKQERASQDFDRDQHVDGFLNEYARGDIEDDFNSFAESLFMKAPGFWDVVDRYKNVNKKAQLTIQFYQRLHPSFTESWFRDLR